MTEVVVSPEPLTRSAMTTRSAGAAAALPRQQHQSPDSPQSSSSSFRGPMTRKRAASINTDDTSHPRIQDLSLHTATTATTSSPHPSLDTPRDLICLCTPAPKVPRPRNAFILYRQHRQAQVVARNPGLANPDISKIIGDEWRAEPEERKNQWKRLAEEEKQRHARQYPDYRYQPRRGNKGAPPRLTTATGEDPGHCPKCGGRYIATPRTPLTPFVSPPSAMAHSQIPRPDLGESYYRHGSQPLSTRGRAPWYGPPHQGLHEIREEYETISPSDPKRRRYNPPGGNYQNYQALPSPPGTYGGHAHPQRSHHSSVSGPPTPGYGPLPGPPMLPVPAPGSGAGHMDPPPRPGSLSSGPVPHQPATCTEFDESLRLPPLQTQLPTSPDSDKSMAAYSAVAAPPAGSYYHHPSDQMRELTFEEKLMSIPYYNKLMALEKISPRLPSPSPAASRGPIIAIEGSDPRLLLLVSSVIERALLASRECDVRSWYPADLHSKNNDTPTPDQIRAQQHSAATSRSGSISGSNPTVNPFVTAFRDMIEWHAKSAEMVKFVTTARVTPSLASHSTAGSSAENTAASAAKSPAYQSDESQPRKSRLPIALLPAGYSLTHSDRAACTASSMDHYEFVDHWQWTGSLWRGIAGPDLVVHAQATNDEEGAYQGVEAKAPGLMVVRVGEKEAREGLSEKTDRRLGFEVVEWVRGGVFWYHWARGSE